MKVLLKTESEIEVENISDVDDASIIDGLMQWMIEGEGLDAHWTTSTVVQVEPVPHYGVHPGDCYAQPRAYGGAVCGLQRGHSGPHRWERP